jgi:hypothetical protein
MAKLIMEHGKPKLFVVEGAPVTDGKRKKQLSVKEENDSSIGVYMYAKLISEDAKQKHPVLQFFSEAKRVRVTFEIVE